jgi:hypothetical protein
MKTDTLAPASCRALGSEVRTRSESFTNDYCSVRVG